MPTKTIAPARRDLQLMEARRLAAIPLLQRGEAISAVAKQFCVSRQAVHVWAKQFRQHGRVGLQRRLHLGHPPKLSQRKLAKLPDLLVQGPEAHGFSRSIWTTQIVADLIWRRFRVRYNRDHVSRLLHRLGWNWVRPTRNAIHRWVPKSV
jgi:transposase